MVPYKLGAYWEARKETIHSCANRLARFLAALSACDEVFATWYKLGPSRLQAKQVEIDFKNTDCLLDLLEAGRNRKDIGKEVIEELGFRVGMWNGEEPTKATGIKISCGSYITTVKLCNSVVLDLPEDLGNLGQSDRMAHVLVAVATSWEPDWAGVFSLEAMNKRKFNPVVPFVDWMLYLSNKLVRNPTVPEPSSTRAVAGIGSLIVVQQEPVEAENPTHLQRVNGVETALAIKGETGQVRF
jgi:hypothetical protein